jgi:GH15 family glucan-1,4-alpha-glucosidase
MNYQPIENYGVIGDLSTAALVSMEGSIDFMCFPRFDSPTIFAALLDHRRGGRFAIAPASGEFKHRQRYFPDTNILLTRFLGDPRRRRDLRLHGDGTIGRQPRNLVRRVKVVRGEIRFRMVCAPKFDYGPRAPPHRSEAARNPLHPGRQGPARGAAPGRSASAQRKWGGQRRIQIARGANRVVYFGGSASRRRIPVAKFRVRSRLFQRKR